MLVMINDNDDMKNSKEINKPAVDFRELANLPTILYSRKSRHGVSVIVVRTNGLSEPFLKALLEWRYEQYKAAGFYEVDKESSGEDAENLYPDDIHALAIDDEGRIAAYVTAKRPGEREELAKYMFRDRNRVLFPAEEVHGRGWQRSVIGVDDVGLLGVWELGRFVSDRSRAKSIVTKRAVLELGLAGAWLFYNPMFGDIKNESELILGDVDPLVALKNLQMFFIPTASFPEHDIHTQDHTALAPRYRGVKTAPVIFSKRDLTSTTHARWYDIDLALTQSDSQAFIRLQVLKMFQYVGESSLRRPVPPLKDLGLPIDALVVPDAVTAAKVMCRAADRGLEGWKVKVLSPGDVLEPGIFVWVVEGFATTRLIGEDGAEHIATAGPQVAFIVPGLEPTLGAMVTAAATPMRVLISDSSRGEAFLKARKSGFDAPAEVLYGE